MNKRKILNFTGLLMGACVYLLSTGGLSAQGNNCAPRAKVIERLAQGYGETRQSMGLAADNVVVEVFASSETGSWTITVTRPGGLTCLVASGQAFEALSEALPAMGKDA